MIAELFLGLQLLDVLKQRDGIGASSTPSGVAIDFGFGTTEEIKAAEAKVRSQMEGLAGLGTFLDTRGIDFAAIREQGDITFGFAEVMKNFNFGIDK